MLSFRDAQTLDLVTIVSIYNSTIASRMVTADTSPASVEDKQEWFANHNPVTRPIWVVEDPPGEIVGWVSFQSFYGRPAYAGTAEISIYLAPDSRGRGYGKEVLNYCLEKAPALGIKTLIGYIFAHNVPSLGLFRQAGFEDWATLPNIARLDETERTLIILGKRVAP